MLKHVMAIAAVSTLALTTALAQTSTAPSAAPSTSSPPAATSTPPSTPNAASPATTAPSTTTTSPSASSSTPSPSAASTTAPATGKFVSQQSADQFLASKFKGTDVIGTDDKKIGDVSDVLFDKNQKVLAYIVGVGGFLGIGTKDVALEPTAFEMVPGKDASDYKLRLSMTKDELKSAPTFEVYKAPHATTTSSNAPTRPMGAPPPATAPAPKQ